MLYVGKSNSNKKINLKKKKEKKLPFAVPCRGRPGHQVPDYSSCCYPSFLLSPAGLGGPGPWSSGPGYPKDAAEASCSCQDKEFKNRHTAEQRSDTSRQFIKVKVHSGCGSRRARARGRTRHPAQPGGLVPIFYDYYLG